MSDGLTILGSIAAITLGTYFFVYVLMVLLRKEVKKNE